MKIDRLPYIYRGINFPTKNSMDSCLRRNDGGKNETYIQKHDYVLFGQV
jgi:hypothetical protein